MCKMQIIYIAAVFLLAGAAQCQQPEIPLELDAIQNKINEIPGLENLNKNVPSLQEILDVAQQKCEQNGGKDAFDRLAAAKDEIQECLESNFNLTQIETELQEKSKTGSMDEVFAKYCSKRPIVEGCLKDLTNAVEPCLEESEKSSMRLLVNITKNLISFGCYKDGDHIAMFLAEGGLECVKNKSVEMEVCANRTLSHHIPTKFTLSSLPLLIITENMCKDYFDLQTCVVGILETCKDQTTANLVDATFKLIRGSTPCKNYRSPSSTLGSTKKSENSSPTNLSSFLIIAVTIFAILHF